MSEVRLVRCPKCDKVLPEPSGVPVYKCGGCGAFLQAKKKSLERDDKLETSCTAIFDKVSISEMAAKSPARSLVDESNGRNSPLRENFETEFEGGLPKSPMRDRFLDDLVKTPGALRDASRSPMRERGGSDDDFDHDGLKSPTRLRYVSKSPVRGREGDSGSVRTMDAPKSPMREQGGFDDFDRDGLKSPTRLRYMSKSPVRGREGDSGSVRTMDAPKSPMREQGGFDDFDRDGLKSPTRLRYVSKSPVRGHEGVSGSVRTMDAPKSPLRERGGSDDFDCEGLKSPARLSYVSKSPARGRGDVSESVRTMDAPKSPLRQSHGSDVGETVEQGNGVRFGPKASFNDWLTNDNHEEQVRDRSDRISEGVESVFSDEHGINSEGSLSDLYHRNGHRSQEGIHEYDRRYARPNLFDGPSNRSPEFNYGYGDPRETFESGRGRASVRELQLERTELLRKYRLLKDQLNGLDDGELSSQGFYSESAGYRVNERFPPRRNVQRPPVVDRGDDLYGYNKNFSRSVNNDQYKSQMKRRPFTNRHFAKNAMPEYVPGRSLDFERDGHETYYASDSNDRYGRDQRSSAAHQRHDSSASNSVSGYRMDLGSRDQRAYDPRMAHTSPREQSTYPALRHHSLNKRLCRPISGGAPFVLCDNCFQLLKLPGNFTAKRKNQQLLCGSCSTVVSFGRQDEHSVPASSEKIPDAVNAEVTDEPNSKHHRNATTSTYIGSYDFDAGDDTLQPLRSEDSRGSKGHRFTSSLPENTLGFESSPSRVSVDSAQITRRKSAEQPVNIRPPPGSSLQEHLDYSSQFYILKDTDKQIIEQRFSDATDTENERTIPEKVKAPKSPMHAILKPLKDVALLPGRGSPGKVEVYVNGQALSQRAAKKAEKLAGKIYPGEYWYDPRAGFWGVMGHQCLGIIPPSIKEFTAPMPENCSQGDTAVYVNGRQLNKRDLGLLARRGLPTTKDKRYVVDISGRVLEEDTRDFVVNLGRLAPSVESRKCGFGMHVPEKLSD